MHATRKSLQASSFALTFRYAALFGGIISLMLLVANIERNGNSRAPTQHAAVKLSP